MFWKKKRIFMDYASTTPLDPAVFAFMKPYFSEHSANPSSIYAEGIVAKKALTDARAKVASVLGCHADEIFFTASGTESNNMAIQGLMNQESESSFQESRKPESPERKIWIPHIIISVIEHPSILETCRALEKQGRAKVSYVGVAENGIVDPKEIFKVLTPETVLVSVMYVNNEIGTIQPLHEIARAIRRYRKEHEINHEIHFHTDASQAANYLPLTVEKLGVDMMTLDASKFYGPKGVGILYKKRTVPLSPIIYGGGQESGLRSATENIPGIVGTSEALKCADSLRESESARLIILRDIFISEILKRFPQASLNGDAKERLPNNINIHFPGIFAEFAVVKLDYAGVAASSASACNNLSNDSSSYVVAALNKGSDAPTSSLRFTLGRDTSEKDIRVAVEIISRELSK